MTHGKPIVGYLRVSTAGQGKSGLGLDGQKEALRLYAAQGAGRVLATYTEVESGKRADNRPELQKAIAHAKRSNATLVIAVLDRLARNVHFISGIMESGVDFCACDNPFATPLTIHILAAVAEDEVKRISKRTKAALQAAKARGVKLGASRPECRNLTQEARVRGAKRSVEVRTEKARAAYDDLLPLMRDWRGAGSSQQAIADKLNELGHTTRRGKAWNQVQVARCLRRAG
ncbi:MAG: recombinase family protein [Candidatus Nealsonbacteria bacterium]|nr:recombinase family protein [Candidatus Nealsonbacteria bacterium]